LAQVLFLPLRQGYRRQQYLAMAKESQMPQKTSSPNGKPPVSSQAESVKAASSQHVAPKSCCGRFLFTAFGAVLTLIVVFFLPLILPTSVLHLAFRAYSKGASHIGDMDLGFHTAADDDVAEDPKVLSLIEKLEALEAGFDPAADSDTMQSAERKVWRQTKSDIKRLKEKIREGAKSKKTKGKYYPGSMSGKPGGAPNPFAEMASRDPEKMDKMMKEMMKKMSAYKDGGGVEGLADMVTGLSRGAGAGMERPGDPLKEASEVPGTGGGEETGTHEETETKVEL